MPTSYMHVIPIICKELELRQPKRVLDVGIGFGKYGFLAREYGHAEIVDGVEGEKRYITDIQRAIYDNLYLFDIRESLSLIPKDYDLVIFSDCIEHMTKEDGHKILQYFDCPILISTPAEDLPQHIDEFPLENHLSKWEQHDFADYPYERIEDPKHQALIVVVRP